MRSLKKIRFSRQQSLVMFSQQKKWIAGVGIDVFEGTELRVFTDELTTIVYW